MSDRVEAVIEALTYTKGVIGVVVCTAQGIPIRDSFPDFDRSQAIQYAEVASELVRGADELCQRDGGMDSLRVRTSSTEILVKSNGEYLLVVVQQPQE